MKKIKNKNLGHKIFYNKNKITFYFSNGFRSVVKKGKKKGKKLKKELTIRKEM